MIVKYGYRVTQARKIKQLYGEELAELICTSAPIAGRYENRDMIPSAEVSTKISKPLALSFYFLVDKSSLLLKNKNVLERVEYNAKLPTIKQTELFNEVDAYLRGYRTSKAYAK